MSKKKVQLFQMRLLLFCFLLGVFFPSILLSYAAKPQYLTIQNHGETSYERCLVRIPLEKAPNGSYYLVEEGSESSQKNASNAIITTSLRSSLLVSTSLQPNQSKVFHIQEKKASAINSVPISTEAGTYFHFVNYENAHIISCENDNQIDIYTEHEQLLDSTSLQKGKSYIFTSTNPTNIHIKTKKPVFVYESSLAVDSIANKESEDSDTTTLFGNQLYFYHPGHLWLSSYKKNTTIQIVDENQLEVKSVTVHPEKGMFIDDLQPGVYSIISSSPITAQFGYVDNENFSYVIGTPTSVHGFCFGDLLFYSPYDNAQIKLQSTNINETFTLQNKGDTKLVSLIHSFSPMLPEYTYFTATCNVPFQVLTFSSGKNFGGEFSPGHHGCFLDSDFTTISSRISKEFSKDQKSLIEIYSQHPHTRAIFSTNNPENDQTVTLNKFALYNFTSSDPLEKVTITSDESLLCLQLNNYTNKGLFYYVPPLANTDISYSFSSSPSDQGGLFTNQSDAKFQYGIFFSLPRWRAFFLQILNPSMLLFTIFFSGLLLLLLILGILLLCKHKKEKLASDSSDSFNTQSSSFASKSNEIENDFSIPEKEESFSSIEKIHKTPVKHKVQDSDQENKSKDNESQQEPFPDTEDENETSSTIQEETKKKIRFDPNTTPVWLSENQDTKPDEKKEHIDQEVDASRSKHHKHRKGLRINDPHLEDCDFKKDLPALDTNEEEIFTEITHAEKQSSKQSAQDVQTNSTRPRSKTLDQEDSNNTDEESSILNKKSHKKDPLENTFKQSKETLKKTLTDSCSVDADYKSNSCQTENKIEKIYQEPVSEKYSKDSMVSSIENLFYTPVVFDPGSANRLFMEGYLQKYSKGFIVSSSAKKLNSAVVALLKTVKLNPNDIAKASTMADVCDTFEEAGKAFSLCKKKRIKVYITSYKLPKVLQGITIYSVQDLVKRFQSKDE
jgi:hypothetical protein